VGLKEEPKGGILKTKRSANRGTTIGADERKDAKKQNTGEAKETRKGGKKRRKRVQRRRDELMKASNIER